MAKLILYFTVGYPDRTTFTDFMTSLNASAVDYVEFGFPSMDPKYDGPTIRRTHSAAEYDGGEDYSGMFRQLSKSGIKTYSLAYVSDIIGDFSNRMALLKTSGFSGILMPDLLIDYFGRSEELISTAHEAGLEVIPFFNPSTPDRVIMNIAALTHSWIYYGIQPSTGIIMPMDMGDIVDRIRAILPDREINFGFGIRGGDQAGEIIRAGGSGIAIGSALVGMMEKKDISGFSSYVSTMREVINAN
ncbi:MAG: hypothetical protein B2I17_05125 [Thermoplasmatales archaeon B_DKE]|nr:MAG: hypothetical protein B2I17_05125 [Thermoplasmatales archaeon B_DKE]